MINFEKQFDNIESKFKEIENNLNNQNSLDTEKLIKLNREYAELTPIVETIKKYKNDKKEIGELLKLDCVFCNKTNRHMIIYNKHIGTIKRCKSCNEITLILDKEFIENYLKN